MSAFFVDQKSDSVITGVAAPQNFLKVFLEGELIHHSALWESVTFLTALNLTCSLACCFCLTVDF